MKIEIGEWNRFWAHLGRSAQDDRRKDCEVMAIKNTDPKITLDKSRTAVEEIDFPDVLSAERMSPNHYFIVFDGEPFNIRRPRRGARWKLTQQ